MGTLLAQSNQDHHLFQTKGLVMELGGQMKFTSLMFVQVDLSKINSSHDLHKI